MGSSRTKPSRTNKTDCTDTVFELPTLKYNFKVVLF